MRHCVLAGICVGLATWSTVALAQSAAPFYVGAPVTITNVPIDTTQAIRPTTSFGQNLLGSSKSILNTGLSLPGVFKTSPVSLAPFPAAAPTSMVVPQPKNIFQPMVPNGGKGPLDGGKVVSNSGSSILGNISNIFGGSK